MLCQQPFREAPMLDTQTEAQNWPFLDHVIGPIADWWRKHAAVRDNIESLDALGPDELARVAQDVGIPASDLRKLAQHCSDAADLLEYRIASLGLSTSDLAHDAPAQLHDMQRLCTMCEHKGRCARDLAADSSDPIWRRYCLNDGTLSALQRDAAAK
jgi:hypothetical protein